MTQPQNSSQLSEPVQVRVILTLELQAGTQVTPSALDLFTRTLSEVAPRVLPSVRKVTGQALEGGVILKENGVTLEKVSGELTLSTRWQGCELTLSLGAEVSLNLKAQSVEGKVEEASINLWRYDDHIQTETQSSHGSSTQAILVGRLLGS